MSVVTKTALSLPEGKRRVSHSSGGAVGAAAASRGSVGGEVSADGGAAKAAGWHGAREQCPQRQDGRRRSRAAAAEGKQGGRRGERTKVKFG